MQRLSFSFWHDWSRPFQITFYALIGLLALALIVLGFSIYTTPAPALELQTVTEAHLQEVPVHHFQKGVFDLTTTANNYVLYDRYLGGPLQVTTASALFYLCILFLAVPLLLAVFTTLNQFYYLVTMGVFILFVVSLRLEILETYGWDRKLLTISVLASYGLSSFYFYYFAKHIRFQWRLVTFLFITFLFATVVFFFSGVPAPFLHLATASLPAALLICTVFALMVAHEIIAAFVFAVTQSSHPTKSLQHFLVICVIYFANLALAYGVRLHYLHWDVITFNFFLLLAISGVLGIWGIRQRKKQFEGVLETDPYGVLAYVALAAVVFSAIAWLFQSANDTATDTIGKIVIYSHIGYGIIFLLYIFSNFIAMLARNMAVHKVLYNPNNMPYFTFRLGGLITTLAFLFYNTWEIPVQNTMASYYNASGDLYLYTGQSELARAYYEKGVLYGYGNHHANYALANMDGAQMNLGKEKEHYENAGRQRPTEMSILNLAQTVQTDHGNLRALISMKEGLGQMRDNGALLNSLGYFFLKTGAYDSALFYFEKASRTSAATLAEANLRGLEAELKVPLSAEEVPSLENSPARITSIQTNVLARLNAIHRMGNVGFTLPTDTTLTRVTAAWINNYLVNQMTQPDTLVLTQIEQLARKPVNESVREPLIFTLALSWYEAGEIQRAIRLLEEVTINSSDQQGKYNNVLAMWALEQDEPERAIGYLEFALKQGFVPAKLTYAVAMTEGRQPANAVAAWDSLLHKQDTLAIALAVRMQNILRLPAGQVFLLSDEDKYAFLRYRAQRTDTSLSNELIRSLSSNDFKAKALLDRSAQLLAEDQTSSAADVLKELNGMELSDPTVFRQIRLQELLVLAELRDWGGLASRMKDFSFTPAEIHRKKYFEAMLALQKGDSATAEKTFRWLARSNSFFEEGILAAARYLQQAKDADPFLPYQILVDATQNHPSSNRIRIAYTKEAARVGFSDFALHSLQELKTRIPAPKWNALKLAVEQEIQTRANE